MTFCQFNGSENLHYVIDIINNYFCTVLSITKLNYTQALVTFVVEKRR